MARQKGPIFIQGTIKGYTYYKLNGKYYIRKKSTLSRKKVLTSPEFHLTRIYANQFREASEIASLLYKEIDEGKKNMNLFRSLVSRAKLLLASGKNKEEVVEMLKVN